MVNRGYVVCGMLALTGVAFVLVVGHHPWAGPELFGITRTHGVNVGDLPILAGWVAGAGLCWRLWSRERQ